MFHSQQGHLETWVCVKLSETSESSNSGYNGDDSVSAVAALCFFQHSFHFKIWGAHLKLQVGEGSPQLGGSSQAGSANLVIQGYARKNDNLCMIPRFSERGNF